jgi:hypothetical protein
VTITITVHPSRNPNTIYNRLAAKLGRVPTDAELCADVRRILTESMIERASNGKLPHQRRR